MRPVRSLSPENPDKQTPSRPRVINESPGPLTSDNSPLSKPKNANASYDNNFATGCIDDTRFNGHNLADRNEEVSEEVLGYLKNGLAENTRRAYAADLRHFEEWGGVIPASEAMVANYLAAQAGKLACATLERRLATLSKLHRMNGLPNPVGSDLVRATMRGIKRKHGVAQRQAKPLMREELFGILDALGTSLRDVRDRALLLVGFAGAFRRSELVGINIEDIEWRSDGVIVCLRSSKTDQLGEGRNVGIPIGSPGTCPVGALKTWLTTTSIRNGPVFRAIDRHGNVNDGSLSGEAVSLILKKRVRSLRLDENRYSGHSLRAGLATSAAAAGIPALSIRQLTGHTQNKTLALYIRNSRKLSDSPIRGLL